MAKYFLHHQNTTKTNKNRDGEMFLHHQNTTKTNKTEMDKWINVFYVIRALQNKRNRRWINVFYIIITLQKQIKTEMEKCFHQNTAKTNKNRDGETVFISSEHYKTNIFGARGVRQRSHQRSLAFATARASAP